MGDVQASIAEVFKKFSKNKGVFIVCRSISTHRRPEVRDCFYKSMNGDKVLLAN